MRKREEILDKIQTTSTTFLTLEVLLDIRDLLKEISDKIRKDETK